MIAKDMKRSRGSWHLAGQSLTPFEVFGWMSMGKTENRSWSV